MRRVTMAVSCAAFVAFAVTSVSAQEAKPDLTDQSNRISYAGGANMGRAIKDTGVGFKADVVVKGFLDAFEGKELLMSEEEIQKALGEFKEMMRGKEEERFKKESVENLGISKKFLEDNKNKEGVKILPSGLQYIIVKEGTGEAKPGYRDAVKVHYRGTFMDGTEFDSSLGKGDEPVVFNVNQVIPGMQEALQLMKKGSKWQLFIPPDLAYGEGGSQGIPPNTLLIFEVELFDIVTQAEIPASPESGVVVPVEPPKEEKPAAEAPKQ